MDDALAESACRQWLGPAATRSRLVAMNSSAWVVQADGERFVLKVSSPTDEPGLDVAAWLADRGLQTGAPVRTSIRDGRLVALLRFVDGRPLSSDDVDAVGGTLGRVHGLLVDAPAPPALDRWPWRWLDTGLIKESTLRSAASAAIERADRIARDVAHGILHGDPAPEAFIDVGRGEVGLIDWGAAVHGPLLYDLASARMYTDERVIEAYVSTGPIGRRELAHVPDFLAFRWALQAWYFSKRLASNDLTGIEGQADNEKGLAHARDGLLGLA